MASTAKHGSVDTAARILDIAERLAQVRGFNAFSYADIANELGIKKASLHYHYPGKAELGQALIDRYGDRFARALTDIDASGVGAPEKLAAYAAIYADVLREHRMCLCGMLAADYDTLPDGMRESVVRFFDDNETWLASVLEQGEREGSIALHGSARDEARAIVSALEGALLVARPYGDVRRFEAAADRLLAGLARA
jgi:TetR/AcrR family transcriptional regulator, transcriptional repressor for nem operon